MTISINGTTIVSTNQGGVVVCNGRVFVDGKDVTPDAKQITIEVQGDVQTIEVDACEYVHVSGSVGQVKTTSGDIRCGEVLGSIKCVSGDILCGSVAGSVSTISGKIQCAKP